MELTCKIVSILPEQRFNGKNGEIVKNSFVVEWMDNGYTQHLCLEVMGADKFEKMKNAVVVGHEVLVKFGVSSREYNQRWYTTANCYYCATIGGVQQQDGTAAHAQANDPSHAIPAGQPAPESQDDSSLPF